MVYPVLRAKSWDRILSFRRLRFSDAWNTDKFGICWFFEAPQTHNPGAIPSFPWRFPQREQALPVAVWCVLISKTSPLRLYPKLLTYADISPIRRSKPLFGLHSYGFKIIRAVILSHIRCRLASWEYWRCLRTRLKAIYSCFWDVRQSTASSTSSFFFVFYKTYWTDMFLSALLVIFYVVEKLKSR